MFTKESHKASLIEALDFHCTNALNASDIFAEGDYSRIGYCEAAIEAAKAVIGQLGGLNVDTEILKVLSKRVSRLERVLLSK